jgi:hypothetical protein
MVCMHVKILHFSPLLEIDLWIVTSRNLPETNIEASGPLKKHSILKCITMSHMHVKILHFSPLLEIDLWIVTSRNLLETHI